MAEQVGSIDYQRLARAVGRANRADRITVDLTAARLGPPNPASLIASSGQRVHIFAKGAGLYIIIFVFQDGSTIQFTNAEINNGDIFDWDFFQLYMINAAQPAVNMTIIVDRRIIVGVGGL